MKLTFTITLAAMATVIGSGAVLADDEQDSHYKALYELKELHVAFHQAISHAGVDAATKAAHLAAMLALWADDGVLKAGGVTYSGKGTPGQPSCAAGSLTLCDFFSNHAGSFIGNHDWVSLTPIFTEAITVHGDTADIYWQCIYLDAASNAKESNVTIGLPGEPQTGQAKKVHGHWLFWYVESEPIPAPTLDVYQ
jgi:hypothetical protein